MDDTPCPHAKRVRKAGGRCPDCTMEQKRRKFFTKVQRKNEQQERLARIAKATPPPDTDDDEEDDVLDLHDDPETAADLDTADAVEAEQAAVASAGRRRRGRPIQLKAAHRQPEPPGDTRGESWWTRTSRENHSATADQELARMSKSKEGRLTATRIIE